MKGIMSITPVTTAAYFKEQARSQATDWSKYLKWVLFLLFFTRYCLVQLLLTKTFARDVSYSSIDNSTISGYQKQSTLVKPSLCNREQIRRGHWKPLQLPKPPYVSKERWERTCYNSFGSREGQLDESPFQSWEWTISDQLNYEENDCVFASFDVDRFCQLNTNRTIAFLGDSITWQQFNSLNLLLGAKDDLRQKTLIKTNACNEQTKLIWKRDNYATAEGMRSIITLSDPDVIVFNRGAHFKDNTALLKGLNETLAIAFEWQTDCDKGKDKRGCLLVWRTTAPGFPDCSKVPGPIEVDRKSEVEALISDPLNSWYTADSSRQDFHWWDFADQNALVENVIQNQTKANPRSRVSFIDFYEMAILRPDNHIDAKDCLHYCLPGPPDASNAVLLHHMEVASSFSEQSRVEK